MTVVGPRFRETADEGRGRFFTEYYCGMSPPHVSSIRHYIKGGEISRDSMSWKIHTDFFEGLIHGCDQGIRYLYGDPDKLSLPQYVLYGQMVQAQLQGSNLEATRFRRNDPENECQGALFWSFNDTWGEMGWSIIDHYLRRKASYYWVKRAATPVKVLVRSRRAELVTRIVNDTRDTYPGANVRYGWMRLDGAANELQETNVDIPANQVIELHRTRLPTAASRNPREWLFAAILRGKGISDDQAIWLLAPHRDLTLTTPVVSTRVLDGALEVRSATYAHGVHLREQGEELLSDNYLDLLPGIPARVLLQHPILASYSMSAVTPIGR